jgi:general secretion pathway protein C
MLFWFHRSLPIPMKTRLKNSLGLCALVMAVWALLGGSTMYWGLRLMPGPAGVPGPALPALTPVADPPAAGHALGRMLGASPSLTSPLAGTAGRFVLLGVVAGPSGHGAALISVDGKPARTFRPGAPVGDGLVLQSVLARQATLGTAPGGPAAITLDMAALKD